MVTWITTLRRRRSWLEYLLLALVFSLVLSLRIRSAVFRLPPDPGYYMFDDARHASFWKVFSYNSWEGYISVLPRLIAISTKPFPLALTAILASLITTLIWSVTAVFVFVLVRQLTHRAFLALLCSAMVVFVPSASESSVGNFGNAKWQLFILATVISISPAFYMRFKWSSILIYLVSGLSNPVAILTIIPILLSLVGSGSKISRMPKVLLICASCTFAVQLLAFRASGADTVRSQIVRWKLGQFATFWNFNFLFPLLLAALVLIIVLLTFFTSHRIMLAPLSVAATTAAVGVISYVQGGLADRYFVAPTVLSWLSLILLFHESSGVARVITRTLLITTSSIFLIGSITWFQASSYLNSGPTWSGEISLVRIECMETGSEWVDVNLSLGSVAIRCKDT